MPSFDHSFPSKLPTVGTSIFSVMSQLANQYNAINLSQGFPDFEMSKDLIELVNKAMLNGYNQYAPMAGSLALREVISEKLNALYQADYHCETEITITAGATQAIFTIISALVQPNDEVIIFKPAYDCYEPAISLFGGKVVPVQLEAPGFSIDWKQIKKMINPKTRMIIINTPHNPSGTMMSEKDMKQLEKLLEGTGIILLSDEVYEHIIFDGKKHQSASSFPGLAERSFVVSSFGKTFHNTGWKVGYCVAPATLMDAFRKVHQFNVFSVNHPVQEALATYLKQPENYLELGGFYQEKRDLFLSYIKDSKFEFTSSEGTYFQLLGYKNISDEPDQDFANRLIREYGIASIPVSVFNINNYDPKILRFCFAKTDETLKKAGEILCKL